MTLTRPELAALPLEERRKIQLEAGLITATLIDRERNQYKPTKRDRTMEPHTNMTPVTEASQKERARQSVEHFSETIHTFAETMRQGEPALRTVKRAGIYAAIWAPVGLGVGFGLLKMARRIFTPSGMV